MHTNFIDGDSVFAASRPSVRAIYLGTLQAATDTNSDDGVITPIAVRIKYADGENYVGLGSVFASVMEATEFAKAQIDALASDEIEAMISARRVPAKSPERTSKRRT